MKVQDILYVAAATLILVGAFLVGFVLVQDAGKNARFVEACQRQGGVVADVFRSSDFCIKDGLIVMVNQ